jgi:hypothetical protein
MNAIHPGKITGSYISRNEERGASRKQQAAASSEQQPEALAEATLFSDSS